jgi:hypothetical protein
MTYSKPEVSVLGRASAVIESVSNKQTGSADNINGGKHSLPAYDLDE